VRPCRRRHRHYNHRSRCCASAAIAAIVVATASAAALPRHAVTRCRHLRCRRTMPSSSRLQRRAAVATLAEAAVAHGGHGPCCCGRRAP
jgi:hypothetical protein